jgi:hypothetical protein
MENNILVEFPVCPYCGYSSPHITEYLQSDAVKDSDGTWNCNNCQKEYNVLMTVKYLFTTTKIES